MQLNQIGNSYNIPIPTYYIELEEELTTIPNTAPPGTIVMLNKPNDFKVYMKDSDGNFNEL